MAAHRRVNALSAQRLHEGDTFGRNARLILSGHPQSFETPALILSSPSSFETAASRPPHQDEDDREGSSSIPPDRFDRPHTEEPPTASRRRGRSLCPLFAPINLSSIKLRHIG